jgi:hypothetical protein
VTVQEYAARTAAIAPPLSPEQRDVVLAAFAGLTAEKLGS